MISESSEGPKKPIDLNRRQTVVNIKGDAIKNLASIFDKVKSFSSLRILLGLTTEVN